MRLPELAVFSTLRPCRQSFNTGHTDSSSIPVTAMSHCTFTYSARIDWQSFGSSLSAFLEVVDSAGRNSWTFSGSWRIMQLR